MKLNEIQLNAFEELKKSNGWSIISEIVQEVIEKDCDLEEVEESLEANEYKTECLARKKAKKLFTQLFSEVEYINKEIEFKKKDYS